MCDYSLQNISSRPARIGDKLTPRDFGTGTRGFAAPDAVDTAVCLLPGTELAFPEGITVAQRSFFGWKRNAVKHQTAIFRQINKETPNTHHDALEFPDGQIVLLTTLPVRQYATVLQLPAQPQNAADAEAQRRAAYAG
jgi:hypothetical protein